MKKALKTTFLYIGTAIGAGFSSGREIALFFGDASPLNVAVSAIFMSALCGLFLIAGKNNLVPKGKIMSFGIFLSASISLCAMIAGGDFVLQSMTGVPVFLGLIFTIIAGIVVTLGIEKIKIANTIIVPLIVLSIVLIFSKLPPQTGSIAFSLSKPILYSGLDVLLGGVIISQEGKNLSYKEIALSCTLTCGFMFGMLYMLQSIVLTDTNGSLMPVLAISQQFNMKWLCGVLILGAIMTTLISSLKIVSDKVQEFANCTRIFSSLCDKDNRSLVVFFCLLIAYPLSFFGFDNIVDNLYPFISVCGVLLTIGVLLKFMQKGISRLATSHKANGNKIIASNKSKSRRVPHSHKSICDKNITARKERKNKNHTAYKTKDKAPCKIQPTSQRSEVKMKMRKAHNYRHNYKNKAHQV